MSESRQQTLAMFAPAVEPEPAAEPDEPRRDAPTAWAPETVADDHRRCAGCGAHVSSEFARVMGDNDGTVHGCVHCCNGAELRNGAPWDADYAHRVEPEGTD